MEFKKGHVHAEKVFNIPFMFKSPEGINILLTAISFKSVFFYFFELYVFVK